MNLYELKAKIDNRLSIENEFVLAETMEEAVHCATDYIRFVYPEYATNNIEITQCYLLKNYIITKEGLKND